MGDLPLKYTVSMDHYFGIISEVINNVENVLIIILLDIAEGSVIKAQDKFSHVNCNNAVLLLS